MENNNTWRLMLKIVGAALALAGVVCLVIAYWDKLMSCGCAVKNALAGKTKYSEFSDYEDELLYED